jgi:nitrate/nitrite transporter NarK
MRAFHLTWLAFFFYFFAWFGISPLTLVVRKEFRLNDGPLVLGIVVTMCSFPVLSVRLAAETEPQSATSAARPGQRPALLDPALT